jgi:hypothetical protein
VWQSPAKNWIINWPKENTITLQSKAGYRDDGFLYFLNPDTKTFDQILKGVGLTALVNPTADYIIYSENTNEVLTTKILDRKNKISTSFSPETFTEKCVWSEAELHVVYCGVPNQIPRGKYPDVWYQGLVSFSDSLWKFNIENGSSEQVMDMKNITDIDIIDPKINEKGNLIIFTNKRDYCLWGYSIESN